MARTDRGLQVRAGRGPLARRALFRPDPQAGAAGLLLRLCAPGSPPLGHPGPRRVGSAAAVGEGRAAGAPGNMAARPSSAASRPPVPEMRLGREVAEEKRRRALNSSHLPTPQQPGPHALSPGASGHIDQKLNRTRDSQNLLRQPIFSSPQSSFPSRRESWELRARTRRILRQRNSINKPRTHGRAF
ncbi:uncharacterized protein LOC113835543 isoform X3 [Cricetulus griseus]|uniref:Uncharacterized protein LOC113835543 isoform X3 n=1 Tax=Cricetulus griseus TaxID=10029 RepID=A0A9J7GX43_CRIGR|nr:uncharacterized protein LOC113835543 isoform X3 [Cricetulus griseus]